MFAHNNYCRLSGLNGRIGVALWALAATLAASPLRAQDVSAAADSAPDKTNIPDQMGDIVVTARRVEESLQKVPVAITAFSGEQLERARITDISSLSVGVPGFTAQTAIQQGAPIYSIRGQHGAINVQANTEPAVQVYFAEFGSPRSIGTGASFFDLQSVQVLKGPQGTLFGRNSTGGAILITPMAPQFSLGGYVQGTYGNYNNVDLEGVLNIPLGDKVAIRGAAKLSKRDGFIKNDFPSSDDDGGEIDEISARLAVLIQPTDGIKSTFLGTYYRSESDGATFKLAQTSPRFLQAQRLDLGGLYTGFLAQDAANQTARGFYRLSTNYTPYAHYTVPSIQNNTEIELTDTINLKNVIGFRRTKERQFSEYSGSSQVLNSGDTFSDSKMISEELQLNGEFGDLKFVFGAFYYREKVRFFSISTSFLSALQFTTIPAYAGLVNTLPVVGTRDNYFVSNSYSAFAHFDYDMSKLLSGLSVSAGVRMTNDRKTGEFHLFSRSGTSTTKPITCTINGAQLPSLDNSACSIAAKLTYTKATYDLSLNYQVTDRTLVYLAHRKGYKAGGFNNNLPSIAEASYDPEYVQDFELGVKTQFSVGDMPVRFNAAAYYQKYDNIQRLVTRPQPNGSSPNIAINAAGSHVYGGEAELSIRPTRTFELSGTYGYVKPKYTSWSDTYRSPTLGFTSVDVSDSHFSYVAKHQFSITGQYTLPIAEEAGDIDISATWFGQSSMYASDVNTANCGPDGNYLPCLNRDTKVPAYNLVNLRANWRNVFQKGFDVSLFMTNALDKKYFSSVLGNLGTLGVVSTQAGPPRMFGMVVKVPFGAK